jgi:thiosulfate sulfurtransferase
MSSLISFCSVADLLASPAGEPPLIIDVRRATDFEQARRVIADAIRRDPAEPDSWAAILPGRAVVVYCAHGRSVSQSVCQRLIELGVSARYLEGGYSAWVAAEAPTVAWSGSHGGTE